MEWKQKTSGEISLKTSTYAVNYGGEKTVRQTRFIIFFIGSSLPHFGKIKFSGGGERGHSRGFSINIEEGAYRSFVIFLNYFFKAKLRLEMAAEHDKHMVHKDLEAKDEEMEQLRFNMQKKVKRYIK